ncbi:hypothetical protein U6X42_12240, partial [Cutibacterium acnes]
MCSSFPNGDGTYTIVMYNPGIALLHWNPADDTIETLSLTDPSTDRLQPRKSNEGISRLISNGEGLWYIPGKGWYDPASRGIAAASPAPEREMTWFARKENQAWGAAIVGSELRIGRWDLDSGQVTDLCLIPDAGTGSVNMTASGGIVAVNLYGDFFRYNGSSGELEIARSLPADSIGHVDCLCRIDQDRLLGT